MSEVKKIATRESYGNALVELGNKYDNLVVLDADLASACWFVMGLLGITMADIAAIWHNIESVMIEEMNQTPPQWPMILT